MTKGDRTKREQKILERKPATLHGKVDSLGRRIRSLSERTRDTNKALDNFGRELGDLVQSFHGALRGFRDDFEVAMRANDSALMQLVRPLAEINRGFGILLRDKTARVAYRNRNKRDVS